MLLEIALVQIKFACQLVDRDNLASKHESCFAKFNTLMKNSALGISAISYNIFLDALVDSRSLKYLQSCSCWDNFF